jgi:hypothetical protein
LDFDANERLVGIEVLDAKRVIGAGKLPRLVIDSADLAPVLSGRQRKRTEATKRNGSARARKRKAA